MSPTEHAQLAALAAKLEILAEQQNEMAAELKALTAQANRWKGAFMVILGAGGLIGWFADKVLGAVKGAG